MTISPCRTLALGCTLVLAACGGEGLTLPPDGAPAHIEVKAGSNQSARVGSTLADSLVVKVTDTQDRPVAGANVVIDFTANGSAASPATVSTDNDGRAAASLVLGTVPGQINGTVGVPVSAGVTPVQAGFVATALAADANGIALVSGNGQTGAVGTTLMAPLVVAVTDAFQNPISGVTVSWSVDAGGGSVSSATSVTDGNGQASVTRTVGNTAGDWTTLATAVGLAGSPVTFTHTATAGNAARVNIVDGNGQSAPAGSKLPKDLVVQLLDDQNNPIPNRAVSWVRGVGDGSPSPETSNTDGNGQARTQWTLGPVPGPNTLTAVVSGVGNAAFNATGTKLGSSTRITSHQPEPSIVGTPVTVGVTVDGSGGTPTGQVTVGGEGAAASCSITLSNGSGSCQLVMTQPGNRDLTATYAGDSRFTGSSDTQKHQVNPAPNAPPVATNDSYSTDEDGTLTVDAANGVLNNDTDADSPTLTAVKDSDPTHGALSLSSNGAFTYMPEANYSGGDSFTYHASDGSSSSSVVSVTIIVAAVNDAPSFTVGGDQTTSVSLGAQVVANWATAISSGPSNESSQSLDFIVSTDRTDLFSSGPSVSADGSLSYTSSGTIGDATVTVRLHDDGGGNDTSPPQIFQIHFVL